MFDAFKKIIFSGQLQYVETKIKDKRRLGYVLTARRILPDNSHVVTMEFVEVMK